MGVIHAELELINPVDFEHVHRLLMAEEDIRQIHVRALVDTGAAMMCINENIQAYLKLGFLYKQKNYLANDDEVENDVVGPILVKCNGRIANCSAVVLKGDSTPLLGVIPMEEMKLIIDPMRQELMLNGDGMRIPTLLPASYVEMRRRMGGTMLPPPPSKEGLTRHQLTDF